MPLNTFEDLCVAVRSANQRKAISATQFNHQSTRGHCILQLEITKPADDNPAQQVKCRMYVCDLAGTEPAADIIASVYQRVDLPDGSIEYKFKGQDPDAAKTRELVNQGECPMSPRTTTAILFLLSVLIRRSCAIIARIAMRIKNCLG